MASGAQVGTASDFKVANREMAAVGVELAAARANLQVAHAAAEAEVERLQQLRAAAARPYYYKMLNEGMDPLSDEAYDAFTSLTILELEQLTHPVPQPTADHDMTDHTTSPTAHRTHADQPTGDQPTAE